MEKDKVFGKDELNNLLGKESLWSSKRLVGRLNYISGFPAFDAILDGGAASFVTVNLRLRPNGVQFELVNGLKSYSLGILKNSINKITIEDKEQVWGQQEKSIVGRAVMGALIAGPAGAIVGGMTGMSTKSVKEKMPDLFISINYSDGTEERVVIFSCQYKHKAEVDKYLRVILPQACLAGSESNHNS